MQIKDRGNNILSFWELCVKFAAGSNRQVIDRGVPLTAFMSVGSDLLLDDTP